jgi:hypothetical protein
MTASHVITPSEEDARWRFTDHPAGEVEHLTLMVHGSKGLALWLSVSALRTCAGRPQSIITADAILFTEQGLQIARGAWPSTSVQIASDLFFIRTDGLQLDQTSCQGTLTAGDGNIGLQWNLRWAPSAEGHRPLSPLCYGGTRSVWTPQVALDVTGEIESQGSTHSIADGQGSLHHVWGRRQPERWIRAWGGRWDDTPDLWFQAMTVQMHAHRLSPQRTSLYTQIRGERTHLQGTVLSARYQSAWDGTTWRFRGTRGDRRIEGWVTAPPHEIVGVDQKDPDGRMIQRLVAGRANAEIVLLRKSNTGWIPLSTGTSQQSVLLEIGHRDRQKTLKNALRSTV